MKDVFQEAGFIVDGNNVFMDPEKSDSLEEYLDRSLAILDAWEQSEGFDQVQDISELEEKSMTKTLGTMSNRGLSNWMSLLLFLTIDIAAILVGIYLLTR